LIRDEGLGNEDGLQSYFIRRIERFLNARRKQIIGWDEILEGGLASNATVMSWRGIEGGVAAAKQGHDVIMTPGSHCYFDYYQGNPRYEPLAIGGYTTLEKVYSYEPIPDQLTEKERVRVLGAQGNVWTEYMLTGDQVEYMAIPRMLALSEVLWSPPGRRNYPDFMRRVGIQFKILDRLDVRYSTSMYQLQVFSTPGGESGTVRCSLAAAPGAAGEIHYTTSGLLPTMRDTKYESPFLLSDDTLIRAASFESGKQVGEAIEQQFVVAKSTGSRLTLKVQPDPSYGEGKAEKLVDGIRGNPAIFGMDWLGFRGTDLDVVIDLGKEQSITNIRIAFFDAEVSWIHLPREINVLVSSDGRSYQPVVIASAEQIRESSQDFSMSLQGSPARYIRVVAFNHGQIGIGRPGEGHGAWLFVDEIVVE
jgi:hexosaminidase